MRRIDVHCPPLPLSFPEVGGYDSMVDKFPKAMPDSWLMGQLSANYSYKDCGTVKELYMNIMRPPGYDNLPWTGFVFGLTVSAVWYWCTDQVIVQRVLGAKVSLEGQGQEVSVSRPLNSY